MTRKELALGRLFDIPMGSEVRGWRVEGGWEDGWRLEVYPLGAIQLL